MKLRKQLCAILALILSLSMVACSQNTPTPTDTQSTQDAPVDTSPVEIPQAPAHKETLEAHLSAIPESLESNWNYSVTDGKATVHAYLGTLSEVRIPQTLGGTPVTAVSAGAFLKHEQIKVLSIPDTVETIGKGALADCKNLEVLSTPLSDQASDGYLGYLFGANSYIDNPKSVPATLTMLRLCGGTKTLSDYALFDCNDLVCVLLSPLTEHIGKFALYNCSSLEQIEGLEQLVTIGEYAMASCTKLNALSFGNSLTSMGFAALFGCRSLVSLTLPFVGETPEKNSYLAYTFGAEYPDFAQGYYPKTLARIVLTEGCTTLGDYAFFECASLREIILPNTLTHIGVRAFYGCGSLWGIDLPNSLTTIRENAFFHCDALTHVTFGESLASIGINAFYNCDSLASIALPMSLTSLPASCFAGCLSLSQVDLGGVVTVGDQAFRGCTAIASVTASGTVDFGIGNDAIKNALGQS